MSKECFSQRCDNFLRNKVTLRTAQREIDRLIWG